MNFGEAQTYVMDRYAIQTGDTAKVAQIKNLLVANHARLVAKHELLVATANIVITGGSAQASAPSDFIRPLYVRNGVIRIAPLDDVDFGDAEAAQAAGGYTSSNPPFKYMWRPPSTIQVIPTPTVNTTLSIPYVQRPAPMSNPTDAISGLPSEFHPMLCELVCIPIGLSEGMGFEPQMAQQLSAELDAELTAWRKQQEGPVDNRIRMRVYG